MNLLVLFGLFRLNFKGKPLFKVILLGIAQPIVYFICESYGIALTNSSFSGTLIAMVPIFAIFFAAAFIREKFSLSQLLWGLCAVIGVIIISLGSPDGTPVTTLGVLLLVIAVASGAMFNVLSRITSKDFSAFERTYIMFALASVVFTLLALIETGGKLPFILSELFIDPYFTLPVIFLSLFSSVIAFTLLNYATTYIAVRQSSIFSCWTTVVSIIAGIMILHEPFGGIRQVVGSLLILAGVYMVSIANTDK